MPFAPAQGIWVSREKAPWFVANVECLGILRCAQDHGEWEYEQCLSAKMKR